MQSMAGLPTKKQAAELDERILDGARLVFCERGIAGASIEEIASRLSLSKHTIYRRHPTKVALLEAVAERDIGRFKDRLSGAAIDCANPLDGLRRTALRYVEIGSSREYAVFYLGVIAEAVRSASLRRQLAAWTYTSLQPIIAAIAGAQQVGSLKAGDVGDATSILIDLMEGVNNHMRLGDHGRNAKAILAAKFDRRWEIFLAAMGSARTHRPTK